MTRDPQILLESVDIQYYSFDQGINSVKDFVMKSGFIRPFAKKKVLEDVNLKIYDGEVVGILGRNGCGKSSLLRCVAGILKSYTGKVQVRGTIAPVLAIGSGIEMELTGIENIKLITSLMGTRSSDTDETIETIQAFSELSTQDLNRQVKTYSTGMISRLSFSIAIATIPDILLIDEVLAVGDAGFQRKCLNRVNEIKDNGCTILFVSHSPADVESICTRGVCLNDGKIVVDGDLNEALTQYNKYFS